MVAILSWAKRVTVTLNSNSTGCFYTGDIVTGIITLDLNQEQRAERIDLEIIGISKAQWNRAMPTIPYIKIYSEKRKVLYIKDADIFGSYSHNNKIKCGVYSYPFHFALPEDLPSTFQSSLAKVCFNIKISSKRKCIRKLVPFTVVGTVNINSVHEMLTSHLHEFDKVFKRVAEKVTFTVKTYKGISSRQNIPFEITISNEKNVRISDIFITLVQKVRYSISSGYTMKEKKIAKTTYKNAIKRLSDICTLYMEIPQILPSTIYITDPMINISYVYGFEVRFPFHSNLYEEIPVTVATVPVIHYDF